VIARRTDCVHVPDELAGFVEAIEANFPIVLPQLLEILLGFGEQRGLGRRAALGLWRNLTCRPVDLETS
jgi:hypothetical protein